MNIRLATDFDLAGFKQVGFKFGGWLDVIDMEKLL
jgi:hypothetical protein